jgi:hypothetical protein
MLGGMVVASTYPFIVPGGMKTEKKRLNLLNPMLGSMDVCLRCLCVPWGVLCSSYFL